MFFKKPKPSPIVAPPVEPGAVASAEPFPSPAAVALVHELAGRVTKLNRELADAERAAELAQNNRAVVELAVGNPDSVIAEAKTAASLARRKLAGAKSELNQAFKDEAARGEKLHRDAWAALYKEFVQPQSEIFAALADGLRKATAELIDTLRSDTKLERRLAAIDSGVADWNKFCREFGAPGNAALDTKPMLKHLRESFDRNLKISERFQVPLAQLSEILNPPPPREVLREKTCDEIHKTEDNAVLRCQAENAE